jgi:hypothetical protein
MKQHVADLADLCVLLLASPRAAAQEAIFESFAVGLKKRRL